MRTDQLLMIAIGCVGILIALLPFVLSLGTHLFYGSSYWDSAVPYMVYVSVPVGVLFALVGWCVQFACSMWG